MPQRNENPARLAYLTYRPSCGYEHLADPDERIIHAMCPDGVHHHTCQCEECLADDIDPHGFDGTVRSEP